jgi:hypothetical protein
MYIDLVPNRGSKPAILLRESIREGKRIRKRTIANLSALTLEQAEAIRCDRAPREDREAAGQAPSEGRRACAVRPYLIELRGRHLPAGEDRL